ncbi:MAG: DUF362 domain-containing protein [Deltaproteobacteria bacterium]|jgi:uncharacterized protein (DUF362 family)|nr:DUF362 domain-containing protein [Deltaproteobacteria bacterium]
MRRRTFLKNLAAGAAAAAAGSALGLPVAAHAQEAQFPDLVAVRGSELTAMFDRALTALGGLGKYVKSGMTVVVKPNMGWAVGPESCANTNPALVAHIVKNALNLGASKVVVFDNTCDNWAAAYRDSGLEAAARDAGATVAPAHESGYFQEVQLPGGQYLSGTALHEAYLEADAVINVPVLKHHGGARMTAAMKNLMGAIWSRGPLHRSGIDESLPDLLLHKKPVLNVVEAMRVMISGGPRGRGDSRYLSSQMLLASEDPVAVDSACASIFSSAGLPVPTYITLAAERGIGKADLSALNVQRLTA